MRSLERWLHQHIFKVGWLLTKNLHTTTILYYTVFLPGVFLHEVIVWFTAGILNVRAIGDFKFPDKQEIAELKLTFVKYDAKKTGAFRLFVINLMPLIGGMAFIWFVVTSVMQTDLLIRVLQMDETVTFEQAFSRLIATPDLLLWLYLAFTVSATMIPNPATLRGGRILLIPIAIAVVALFGLGVGVQVLTNFFTQIAQGANLLTGVFISVIVMNLFMTAVLGAIESTIERITGDSATFEKGKLIALRREDILRMRAEQAEKVKKAIMRQDKTAAKPTVTGPPSIYRMLLPIPDPPEKEIPAIAAPPTSPLLESKPASALPPSKPIVSPPAPTAKPAAAPPKPVEAVVTAPPSPSPASGVSGSAPAPAIGHPTSSPAPVESDEAKIEPDKTADVPKVEISAEKAPKVDEEALEEDEPDDDADEDDV